MRRTIEVWGALFTQMLKVRLSYKGDFFAELFATALGGVASLAFVVLLFLRTDQLGGWSREEILFVYGMSMMSYGLFGCVSINLFEFGDRYVIEGRFDRVLLRPVGTYSQVLFDNFRIPALAESAIGLSVVLWSAAHLPVSFGLVDVLFALAAILSGAVLFISVFTMLASLSFHFEDRVGVSPPIFNMIAFGRYPQTIFPSALRFLLRWVVPFGFVAFYPAQGLLGHRPYAELVYLSPLVALVFAFVASRLWKWGVRHYESTGS